MKDITNKGKRPKSENNILLPEVSKKDSYSNEEELCLLQREKSLLMSKIKKTKKDLFEMRANLKQREFQALQDSEKYILPSLNTVYAKH